MLYDKLLLENGRNLQLSYIRPLIFGAAYVGEAMHSAHPKSGSVRFEYRFFQKQNGHFECELILYCAICAKVIPSLRVPNAMLY